jgi:signal transduction histidine kinase
MTPKTSRSSSSLVIAGAAIIALSLLLVAAGLGMNDFSRPGEGVLSGRSNVLVLLSVLLAAGLASWLLVALRRTSGRRQAGPGGAKRAADTGPAQDSPAEILSDTADELKMSVATIEEGLEEFLEEEAPADREHLLVLYEETDRLKKIISAMEQLSQAQEIARTAQKEPVELEPLLRSVADRTRAAVPDKEITYAVDCEPGLTISADRESLDRIVGNITDNAARFIRDSGTVTLTAGRREGRVVLSVRDTGPGIRRAHVGHIYEHFFRGAGHGVGMGLSIVKELVDAFHGTIEVRTAVNQGTTVTVELPEA